MRGGRLLLSALLGAFLQACTGFDSDEVEADFFWSWGDSDSSTYARTCEPLDVTARPRNESSTFLGHGPYYMIAYPLKGTPRISLIGSDPKKLTWQNTYAPDTELILQVVDSSYVGSGSGGSGGVSPEILTSEAGSSTDCVIEDVPGDFTAVANVTIPQELSYCNFWAITAKGGDYPLNFTLLTQGSSHVTNVTSRDQSYDSLVYLNKADPARTFLVAVSDVNGRYAYGHTAVLTVGMQHDCVDPASGQELSSGWYNSDILVEQAKERARAANSKTKRKKITIGVVVPIGVLLSLGVVSLAILRKRRNDRRRRQNVDLLPRAYGDDGSPKEVHGPDSSASTLFTQSPPTSPSHISPYSPGSDSDSLSQSTSPSSTSVGGRRTNKRTQNMSETLGRGQQRHDQVREENVGHAGEEVVFQHRDGGGFNMREIPPSYAELAPMIEARTSAAGPSSYRNRGPDLRIQTTK